MTPERALLDRGDETDVLSRLIADAARGSGGIVVLEGPAGIGKTTLVRCCGEMADEFSLSRLRATGSELETGFPFGVVRQLLESTFEGLSPARRTRALAGSAGPAEQILGARSRLAGAPVTLHSAAHALFRLTANLTRDRPTLITVDDAHWADLTSLHFLHYLARRIEDSPIALLVAARPATSSAQSDPLRALLNVDGVRVIRPAPLSKPAVAELIRRALGAEPAPEFVASCAYTTGGNAFLVTELLKTLAREGSSPSSSAALEIDRRAPTAVIDRIAGWLSALPESGTAVVRSLVGARRSRAPAGGPARIGADRPGAHASETTSSRPACSTTANRCASPIP